MNDTFVYMQSLKNLYPKIAEEWHPTKNGDLKPDQVPYGSDKKVWWKCPKGEDHEWEAQVYNRSHGTGCPFCSRRRAGKDSNLAVLFPDLAKEWHYEKNGDLKPENFAKRSGKKVWWQCPKEEDHDWETTIAARSNGSGCPYCVGQKVSKDNNFAELFPDIAKEWHPAKNGDLKPDQVSFGSKKKVWWQCPKGEGHEWETQVCNRSNGTGCPFCSGRRATKQDLQMKLFPY